MRKEDIMEIKKLNKENFNELVLNNKGVVLVDFYADWCGPCKMLGPVIEELSKTTDKDVFIGKLNVDAEPEIAGMYNVYSIPTLMVVKNGKVARMDVGFKTLDQLEEFINV